MEGGTSGLKPWLILMYFCGGSMLCYLDRGLISGFVPIIETEFGMSNAETGKLGSVCLVGLTVGCLLVGDIMLRIRPERMMWVVAGGFVCCAASALIFASCDRGTPRVILLACRCLNGLGEAGVITTGPPLINDIAPPERKSLTEACFTS